MILATALAASVLLPGFRWSGEFREQHLNRLTADQVRYRLILGPEADSSRPTRLTIYATPNGNTIEQTLGTAMKPGLDWHYDIQHVAAQWRWARRNSDYNEALAVVQPRNRSWPAWRRETPDSNAKIRSLVEDLRKRLPGTQKVIELAGHSGGGSFLNGYVESGPISLSVSRIAWLDANYSFSAEKHAERLLLFNALGGKIVSLAYDDREIELNGKKVVGPTGGTFRATSRMALALGFAAPDEDTSRYGWHRKGINLLVEKNPENKILHTRLVEENGLLYALGAAGIEDYRGDRLYNTWIGAAPLGRYEGRRKKAEWPHPATALDGEKFLLHLEGLDRDARESLILREFKKGHVPPHLREFHAFRTRHGGHEMIFWALPDYLALGEVEWARIPMQPKTGQRIADELNCILPTRRLVDAIYDQSEVKLEPQPLTQDRESPKTFLESHRLIEGQRAGRTGSISGIKKDYVITNRLLERRSREAIYGWHWLTGDQIQPLSIVHTDWYVDYSHGVRLIHQMVEVDGKPMKLEDVMQDEELWPLASDEGPLTKTRYE